MANNAPIMTLFNNQKWLNPNNLRILHYCRTYLQSTYISDIASTDGKQVLAQYFNQISDRMMYPSTLQWPAQGKPDQQ
eukprot:6928809-Ditylum_brightwellii.AAC.1